MKYKQSSNLMGFTIEKVAIVKLLPKKLADLSYLDAKAALNLMADWGNGVKPICEIWYEVNKELEKYR